MRGSLVLLPAVDVASGRAAQVSADLPARPLDVAQAFVDQGAQFVHLVDLDRAFGRGSDPELMETLVEQLPVPVQLSGGITGPEDLAWAARTDAARVVLGSSALASPEVIERAVDLLGERLVVAIDVREGQVVARGTSLVLGAVEAVVAEYAVLREGGARVLVADASRDGRRTGADLTLFRSVAELVGAPVTASGGVAVLEDLRALRDCDEVDEVVLGAALHDGAFTLGQALEVTA